MLSLHHEPFELVVELKNQENDCWIKAQVESSEKTFKLPVRKVCG